MHSSFRHLFDRKSKRNDSLVMTNLPESPIAPPKRTALDLETNVNVCPNLAAGTYVSPGAYAIRRSVELSSDIEEAFIDRK